MVITIRIEENYDSEACKSIFEELQNVAYIISTIIIAKNDDSEPCDSVFSLELLS